MMLQYHSKQSEFKGCPLFFFQIMSIMIAIDDKKHPKENTNMGE